MTIQDEKDEIDSHLDDIARDSAEIFPAESLTDEVMRVVRESAHDGWLDESLESIGRRSAEIALESDFTESVMASVQNDEEDEGRHSLAPISRKVNRAGRFALITAGLIAAASVMFSLYTESSFDSNLGQTVDAGEAAE